MRSAAKLSLLHRLYLTVLGRSPGIRTLSRDIRDRRLTFVNGKKLRRLAQAIGIAKMSRQAGLYIEAGVASGGTAIFIAKLMPPKAPLRLYDVFGMIPPPGEQDSPDAIKRYEVIRSGQSAGIDGDIYYGYQDDLQNVVAANLRSLGVSEETFDVQFIKGKFEDTLKIDSPVVFAHIDCDWYASVMTCIERIWPKLVVGGVMVFDDYRSYEGCRKAVDEFVASTRQCEILFSDVSFALRRQAI